LRLFFVFLERYGGATVQYYTVPVFNFAQVLGVQLGAEKPMRDKNASLSREKAAQREQMLTSIGQWLKLEYDVAQPLPDRLSDLVRKIEQSPASAGEQA
jgi:hypothetical protein